MAPQKKKTLKNNIALASVNQAIRQANKNVAANQKLISDMMGIANKNIDLSQQLLTTATTLAQGITAQNIGRNGAARATGTTSVVSATQNGSGSSSGGVATTMEGGTTQTSSNGAGGGGTMHQMQITTQTRHLFFDMTGDDSDSDSEQTSPEPRRSNRVKNQRKQKGGGSGSK